MLAVLVRDLGSSEGVGATWPPLSLDRSLANFASDAALAPKPDKVYGTCPTTPKCMVLGTWYQVLGARFQVLASWHEVLGTWFQVFGSWYEVKYLITRAASKALPLRSSHC